MRAVENREREEEKERRKKEGGTQEKFDTR